MACKSVSRLAGGIYDCRLKFGLPRLAMEPLPKQRATRHSSGKCNSNFNKTRLPRLSFALHFIPLPPFPSTAMHSNVISIAPSTNFALAPRRGPRTHSLRRCMRFSVLCSNRGFELMTLNQPSQNRRGREWAYRRSRSCEEWDEMQHPPLPSGQWRAPLLDRVGEVTTRGRGSSG
jgi:hypothetical protein